MRENDIDTGADRPNLIDQFLAPIGPQAIGSDWSPEARIARGISPYRNLTLEEAREYIIPDALSTQQRLLLPEDQQRRFEALRLKTQSIPGEIAVQLQAEISPPLPGTTLIS